MLLDFIASVFAGLGVAGAMMAIRWMTQQRLPIYWVSASAGVSMILMMVYLEYTWAGRTINQLPEGVVVTAQSQDAMWYRPWTYIQPLTLRLVAVDTRRNRHHALRPQAVMTTVMLLGRWMPVREIPVIFDCSEHRRADLSSEVTLQADGSLLGATWRALPKDDRALEVACANIKS